MYYTGYIRSSKVSRIQVDPGSALSIMPRRVLHLGIPTHRLSATQTIIYGFKANGTCPMEKIKLRCQIGDLRSEVTCYVIDADTSYSLLLRQPWIHRNSIIPSTLHQVMKYTDEDGEVRTLIAEKHPFKGVEIYFTDSSSTKILSRLLRIPVKKTSTLATKADTEPEPEEESLGNKPSCNEH